MLKKVFMILSVSLCALLIPAAETRAADADVIENNEAGIPDKVLYQEILKELGKKTGDAFTEEEAKGITALDLYSTEIQSLAGIGNLSELKELRLQDTSLRSLNGIETLTVNQTAGFGSIPQ